MKKKYIIKRKGHQEEYDEKKVYASVYASCICAEYGEKRAEAIAKRVTKAVTSWVKKQDKKNIALSSNDIRIKVLKNISDKDVALLYRHHLDFR